ncbi:MAG: LssY C-terminal domain-containing protein [Candidatus Saccharimonadales bacterium]
MHLTVLHTLWRLLVGGLVIILAYVTFFLLYPYLDNHLPFLIVLIVLYLWLAYVGIPVLVRIWRSVFKPSRLPVYATTGDGWSSDPVNIAIVCKSKNQLIKNMHKAGWSVADKATLSSTFRTILSMILRKSYATAPFTNLYLFGRAHDIGFQIESGEQPSPRHRHHIRFWQLQTKDSPDKYGHTTFWNKILSIFTKRQQEIWIGAATYDSRSIAFRIQNLQVTHQIDDETDKERDFVVNSLKNKGLIKRLETITAGEPLEFRGQTFGVTIVTDGTLKVAELKNKLR